LQVHCILLPVGIAVAYYPVTERMNANGKPSMGDFVVANIAVN
jgi:hypothetical protein